MEPSFGNELMAHISAAYMINNRNDHNANSMPLYDQEHNTSCNNFQQQYVPQASIPHNRTYYEKPVNFNNQRGSGYMEGMLYNNGPAYNYFPPNVLRSPNLESNHVTNPIVIVQHPYHTVYVNQLHYCEPHAGDVYNHNQNQNRMYGSLSRIEEEPAHTSCDHNSLSSPNGLRSPNLGCNDAVNETGVSQQPYCCEPQAEDDYNDNQNQNWKMYGSWSNIERDASYYNSPLSHFEDISEEEISDCAQKMSSPEETYFIVPPNYNTGNVGVPCGAGMSHSQPNVPNKPQSEPGQNDANALHGSAELKNVYFDDGHQRKLVLPGTPVLCYEKDNVLNTIMNMHNVCIDHERERDRDFNRGIIRQENYPQSDVDARFNPFQLTQYEHDVWGPFQRK